MTDGVSKIVPGVNEDSVNNIYKQKLVPTLEVLKENPSLNSEFKLGGEPSSADNKEESANTMSFINEKAVPSSLELGGVKSVNTLELPKKPSNGFFVFVVFAVAVYFYLVNK